MPVHAGELFITRYEYKIAVARYNPYPIAFLFLSKAKNDMHLFAPPMGWIDCRYHAIQQERKKTI